MKLGGICPSVVARHAPKRSRRLNCVSVWCPPVGTPVEFSAPVSDQYQFAWPAIPFFPSGLTDSGMEFGVPRCLLLGAGAPNAN
jgi:hypothetical protein